MKSVTTEGFVRALEASRLLSPEQIARVRSEVGENVLQDAVPLARELARDGLLTHWQASMLLRGHTAFFLGKYKLLKELGRGGMGAVFQAEQARLGRIVALKIMSPQVMKDPSAVARFEREIQAASALSHPNVVAAFDAGHHQNTHFLVMEYVAGEGLDAVVKREAPLPIAVACEYARQTALGLQHAFEQGMAHRDIKPSNLLLTWTADREPLVKILDMGLARFTSGTPSDARELTHTGQVMGTPDFIAPEQAQNTKEADIRSDLFSLGCTLFQMLTARLPYQGANVMEKLMARALRDAPPLRQFRPDAPPALEQVVARLLARQPASRFQTPAELAAALQPFLVAQTLPSAVRMGQASATPVDVVAAAGAAAEWNARASGVNSAGTREQDVSDLQEPHLHQFLQQLAHEAEADEEVMEAISGESSPITGIQDETRPIRAETRGGGVTRAGQKLRAQLKQQDRRDRSALIQGTVATVAIALVVIAAWIWHRAGATQLVMDWPEEERHSRATLEVDGLALAVPAKGVIAVPKGRAGKRSVAMTRPGYLDIETSLEFQRGESKPFRPEWKPTQQTVRRRLLKTMGAEIDALHNTLGGKWPADENPGVRDVIERYREAYGQFLGTAERTAYQALGRKLPSAADRLSAQEIPVATRTHTELAFGEKLAANVVAMWGDSRLKHCGGTVVGLAVSPDGKMAASGCEWGVTCVWNLDTGELHQPPILSLQSKHALAFSDDGEWLAIGAREIEIWSTRTKTLTWSIPIEQDVDKRSDGLTFVPGRRWWAWGGMGEQVHRCDQQTQALLPPLEMPASGGLVRSVAASRDGRWLAAGGMKRLVRVWDLEHETSIDLETGDEHILSLAFSPDGQTLLIGGSHVEVWDRRAAKRVQEIHGFAAGVNSLSWNNTGALFSTNTGHNSVKFWSSSTAQLQETWTTRGAGYHLGQFAGEGRFVIAGWDGEIEVRETATQLPVVDTAPQVVSAAVDPWGDWVALGLNDQSVERRSLANGEIVERIPWGAVPMLLAVSPDGRWLAGAATHDEGGEIRIREVSNQDAEPPREPSTLFGLVHSHSLAFTADTQLVLSAGRGALLAWNPSDQKQVFRLELKSSQCPYEFCRMSLSADGKTLLVGASGNGVGARGEISLVAMPAGKLLKQVPAELMGDLLAARDGRHAFVASGTAIYRFDLMQVRDPTFGYFAENHPGFLSLVPSADGSEVLGNSFDGNIRYFPMDKLDVTRTLTFGPAVASAKQVLPTSDGRHLVLVEANGCVWVVRVE